MTTPRQAMIELIQKAFHEADENGCTLEQCWSIAIAASGLEQRVAELERELMHVKTVNENNVNSACELHACQLTEIELLRDKYTKIKTVADGLHSALINVPNIAEYAYDFNKWLGTAEKAIAAYDDATKQQNDGGVG